MCNAANMDNDTRHYVANEALSHSIDLDNLIVDKLHEKSRYERFGLQTPKWATMGNIRTFGEAEVVKKRKREQIKRQRSTNDFCRLC